MAGCLQTLGRVFVTAQAKGNIFRCLPSMLITSTRSVNYNRKAMPELEEYGELPKKTPKWLAYNDIIYPPTGPNEEPRPAYVCHSKLNFKYPPKKMWYVACFVRGMSVEEALNQLEYVNRKGAVAVKETISEAIDLAVEKHNVEFRNNLWVAESFVTKGEVIKGMRRHARGRYGVVLYRYCNYYVRLEEGKPPENYYKKPKRDKETLLNDWLEKMRHRKVNNSL